MMDTKYYDALHGKKRYYDEAKWLRQIVQRHTEFHQSGLRCLDLGCGTGSHALALAFQADWDVVGVDKSETLIELAKSKLEQAKKDYSSKSWNVTFDVRDFVMQQVEYGRREVVTALFHVVNFLKGHHSVREFFAKASRSLVSGGLFIFDAWGPASDLQPRLRTVHSEEYSIYEIMSPVRFSQDTRISLHCHAFVKKAGEDTNLYELHRETILVRPICEHMVRLMAEEHNFQADQIQVYPGFAGPDWFYVLRKR